MESRTIRAKGEDLLVMDGIGKAFGEVRVLEDVHFDLRAGEVHVLAGENGAGKSTLMKILGGVYSDHSGRMEVEGREVRFRSVPEASGAGISIIHQELSIIGSLSVAENIFLGREVSRGGWLVKGEMESRAAELVGRLGLELDVRRAADEFPIGVQQMVEIAKALAFDARIIVMDEPTSALTEPEAEKLFEIVGRLREQDCGVIYITHKMEEIYRIADRITVLRDGKYIGTESSAKLDQAGLIKWMIGRELTQQFPERRVEIGEVVLGVEDLWVSGTEMNPSPRVDGVSFEVRAGEVVGLAGLQGSGNSDVLHGIFGGHGKSARGQVTLGGERFRLESPARSIRRGMALLTNDRKESGLVLEMDIVENSSLAALPRLSPGGWLRPGRERAEAQRLADMLRTKAESVFQGVDALSGGNQQKVALAKWLETRPKVWLLDEPTRGVDVGAKHDIYELLNRLTGEGLAVVLITSEMPELLALSDRVLVMHRGRITAEYTRAEATQERVLAAALGEEEQ